MNQGPQAVMPMLEYSLISLELALLMVVLWISKLPYGWVISIAYGRTGCYRIQHRPVYSTALVVIE